MRARQPFSRNPASRVNAGHCVASSAYTTHCGAPDDATRARIVGSDCSQICRMAQQPFSWRAPAEGWAAWVEAHCSADFEVSFVEGKVKQNKEAFVAGISALLKSDPDLRFARDGPIAYANSPTLVAWVATVKGAGAKTTRTFPSYD